jgi:hypothetical protein
VRLLGVRPTDSNLGPAGYSRTGLFSSITLQPSQDKASTLVDNSKVFVNLARTGVVAAWLCWPDAWVAALVAVAPLAAIPVMLVGRSTPAKFAGGACVFLPGAAAFGHNDAAGLVTVAALAAFVFTFSPMFSPQRIPAGSSQPA